MWRQGRWLHGRDIVCGLLPSRSCSCLRDIELKILQPLYVKDESIETQEGFRGMSASHRVYGQHDFVELLESSRELHTTVASQSFKHSGGDSMSPLTFVITVPNMDIVVQILV